MNSPHSIATWVLLPMLILAGLTWVLAIAHDRRADRRARNKAAAQRRDRQILRGGER